MPSYDDIISISKDGDAVRVEFLTNEISEVTMMQAEDELLRLVEDGGKPDIKLDFTQAELPPSKMVDIHADAIFGSVVVLLPEGAELEIKGMPIFGSFEHKKRNKKASQRIREWVAGSGEGEGDPEFPWFRVTGRAIFGDVKVESV